MMKICPYLLNGRPESAERGAKGSDIASRIRQLAEKAGRRAQSGVRGALLYVNFLLIDKDCFVLMVFL